MDRGRALSATPLPQRDPDSSAPARRQLRPSALQGPATPRQQHVLRVGLASRDPEVTSKDPDPCPQP